MPIGLATNKNEVNMSRVRVTLTSAQHSAVRDLLKSQINDIQHAIKGTTESFPLALAKEELKALRIMLSAIDQCDRVE